MFWRRMLSLVSLGLATAVLLVALWLTGKGGYHWAVSLFGVVSALFGLLAFIEASKAFHSSKEISERIGKAYPKSFKEFSDHADYLGKECLPSQITGGLDVHTIQILVSTPAYGKATEGGKEYRKFQRMLRAWISRCEVLLKDPRKSCNFDFAFWDRKAHQKFLEWARKEGAKRKVTCASYMVAVREVLTTLLEFQKKYPGRVNLYEVQESELRIFSFFPARCLLVVFRELRDCDAIDNWKCVAFEVMAEGEFREIKALYQDIVQAGSKIPADVDKDEFIEEYLQLVLARQPGTAALPNPSNPKLAVFPGL